MNQLKYGENDNDVYERVNNFLAYLLAMYQNTDEVILLVTHMSVVEEFLKMKKIPYRFVKMGGIYRII